MMKLSPHYNQTIGIAMNRLLIIKLLAFIFLSLTFSFTYAQNSDINKDWRNYNWKEKKNKDGIKIYTSNIKNSKYDAVYGTMIVNSAVNSLVALVRDTEACQQWADLCKESRVEKKISEVEYYVYTYNDIPFPVTDRDVVAKVKWSQDPNILNVIMTTEAVAGIVENTNAVRIEEADSRWYFLPQEDGTTKVETFAHINPNGPTPAWLTNMLLVGSPFKTMRDMRNIVEGGAYADADNIFIPSQ
jgi:hypothetical protein